MKKNHKEWREREAENPFLWIKNYFFTIEILMLLSLGFNLKYIVSGSIVDLVIVSVLLIVLLSIFLSHFIYMLIHIHLYSDGC